MGNSIMTDLNNSNIPHSKNKQTLPYAHSSKCFIVYFPCVIELILAYGLRKNSSFFSTWLLNYPNTISKHYPSLPLLFSVTSCSVVLLCPWICFWALPSFLDLSHLPHPTTNTVLS